MKKDLYTGVRKLPVSHQVIGEVYEKRELEIRKHEWGQMYPNMCVVLKCTECKSHSVLTRVSPEGTKLLQIPEDPRFRSIKARNKEQKMLMDLLADDRVPLTIVTGHAGTGKTIVSAAVAFHKVFNKSQYDSVILTKPMTQVGGTNLGAVPGDLRDKFDPYLLSFYSNFEKLFDSDWLRQLESFEEAGLIRCIPVSVMRGASFSNAFVIADEAQNLTHHQMKTLCTRMGENTKLVLMGDLDQIDTSVSMENTGLYKLIHDKRIKESPLTSYIELIKGCRSPLADLVSSVL